MNLFEDYEPEPPRKFYSCPECLGELLPREGKYGLFYGCENYPNCKFTCSEDEYAGVYRNISERQNSEQERKERKEVTRRETFYNCYRAAIHSVEDLVSEHEAQIDYVLRMCVKLKDTISKLNDGNVDSIRKKSIKIVKEIEGSLKYNND